VAVGATGALVLVATGLGVGADVAVASGGSVAVGMGVGAGVGVLWAAEQARPATVNAISAIKRMRDRDIGLLLV
jgi:hypothetical protein